jgi:hypothetical protein
MKTVLVLTVIVSALMIVLYKPLETYGRKEAGRSQITLSPNHSISQFIIDTCKTDSLQHTIDSLRTKLFIANYKLERVKYYLNITIKDPSQTKFLKGWIKRAIH